jgi:hypothetical protein
MRVHAASVVARVQLLCVGDMNAPNVTFSYIVPTAAGRDLHREHEWQRLDRQYMWREAHEWYVWEHVRAECPGRPAHCHVRASRCWRGCVSTVTHTSRQPIVDSVARRRQRRALDSAMLNAN